MFLKDSIHRKLEALLTPWLVQEPDLDLKLGFLRSHGVATDLTFDTSVLNREVFAGEATRLSFKEFKVKRLSLHVSYWSAPTFVVRVEGVRVVLSLEGSEDKILSGAKRRYTDVALEERKKALAEIDPEGSALHDAIQKVSDTNSLRNRKSSFLNAMLERCQLQIYDIYLLVQFSFPNDLDGILFKMKEFNVASSSTPGCFLGALIGSLIGPLTDCSLSLAVKGFKVGLKKRDEISSFISSVDLVTRIKLKDLQFVDCNLHVPELSFSFTPAELAVVFVLYALLFSESSCTRNGRHLWNIAADRIISLIPTPKISLHELVLTVCLWLQYVNNYEDLLRLVEYPKDVAMKMSTFKMSENDMFSASVKKKWKSISEVEKKLPVEAIARARRITRYRVALGMEAGKQSNSSLVNEHFKFRWRMVLLLSVMWGTICKIFNSFFSMLAHVIWHKHLQSGAPRVASEDSFSQSCFILSVGLVSINVSPLNPSQTLIYGDQSSDVGSSSFDLLRICVSLGGLIVSRTQNVCEQCFTVSCGQLKIISSSFTEDSTMINKDKKGSVNEGVYDLKRTVLRTETAHLLDFPENCRSASNNGTGGTSVSFSQDLFGEIWSDWKRSCTKFEGSGVQCWERPWMFCEIKKSITDLRFECLSSGFLKCSLMLGKLYLSLDCSSILSTALVLRQIQTLCFWTQDNAANIIVPAPVADETSQPLNLDEICKSYVSEMENRLLKMLPQKYIQIAVFIDGPLIRLSLSKELHHQYTNRSHSSVQDESYVVLDLQNIELAVRPTLTSDVANSSEWRALHDTGQASFLAKEHQTMNISESGSEKFTSRGKVLLDTYLKADGLEAFLDDSTEKKYQIALMKPTTIKLSSTREDLYSFSAAIISISATWQLVTAGLTVCVFMDEIFVLSKVLIDLYTSISSATCGPSIYGGARSQQLLMLERLSVSFEKEVTLMTRTKSLTWTKAFCMVNGSSEIRSMEIVLQNSRRSIIENYAINSRSRKEMVMHDLLDYGTIISSQKMSLKFSFREGEVEINADLCNIRSAIFGDQSETWTASDHFQVRNLLDCLSEMSLSHFSFALGLSNPMCSPTGIAPPSDHWLVMTITTSKVNVAGLPVKETRIRAQESNELKSSLFVGRDLQTVAFQIKGGSIFVETTALALFVKCFASYHRCVKNLLLVLSEHVVTGTAGDMAAHKSQTSQVEQIISQQMTWEQLEEFTVDLSQFSLILVAADEFGGFRELRFEADFLLNLENKSRRFSFDLSRFSILSQTLHEVVEQQASEIQIPHFPTFPSSDLSSHSIPEDSAVALRRTESTTSILDEASCSSSEVSMNKSLGDNLVSKVLNLSQQKYILKRLGVSIRVERPVLGEGDGTQRLGQGWTGSGAISGLEITISLQEMQMILSAFESLSGVSGKEAANNVDDSLSPYQESDRSLIETLPDGALVAIQDVDQHMYMAVDCIEGKYTPLGTIHYSLVGEKAIFRVKYQNQKRWRSSSSWFSLISIYAKSSSGEPLRLNYRKGSGFVDISCSSDDTQALWTTISCNSEDEEGEIKDKSYSFSAQKTFFFVNKKIDQAVAFVDEVPEFVTKPGNPFKWKVFPEFSLVHDVPLLLDAHCRPATSVYDNHVSQNRASGQIGSLPRIDISIDKVIVTIVHELLDTKEAFPLLQASICTTEFFVQLLFSKVRAMGRISFGLCYFDGQSYLWREFVDPVEVCIFYRSRFQIQSSEICLHSKAVCFYARLKQFVVSVSEFSLDMLLFVIGALDLAGPYGIKVSKILANCCKVQNRCGIDLMCHFYDNQAASVASNQTSTIFLRHLASVSQPPEASNVSIQLAQRGSCLTSPIRMSLLEAGSLAWRTRIMSTQDSKTYPGPFLVIDVSKKSEDGFSVSVSPLLRIHNETKFSMELRFRRPQQDAAKSASVVLKTGDTFDDSVAAFDAVNFVGALKKALMSLSIGNFLLSFRPEITEDFTSSKAPISVEWSIDLKGGKTVRISGVFDKLNYKVRKAFSVNPVRHSFSSVYCSLKYEDGQAVDVHFLIQSILRDVPVILPDNFGHTSRSKNSPVAVQEQKEIFILPTFRILNLLQEEIHVLLTDTDPNATVGCRNIGNQATIPCGSTFDLYANPDTIYFVVTLTAFSSSCKPVNSGDCLKKLQKQKNDVAYLDIDLSFGGGQYFASLRLSRGYKGVMEVAIFTSYTLRNDTDFSLLCFGSNQKSFSRDEAEKLDLMIPPQLGLLLPPKSTKSWFMNHNKLHLKLMEEKASEVLLDLDALSGLAEISLEAERLTESKTITKLGVSLGPLTTKVNTSSQIVTMVPRYVVSNESEETVIFRQCGFEEGVIEINSKQRIALRLQSETTKKETTVFEKLVHKHMNIHDDSSTYIQFRLKEAGQSWSGPVCVASLGRFFLKFRRSSNLAAEQSYHVKTGRNSMPEFAAVHAVEENSTLVLHFHKPPDINLPYRIENNLHQTLITYYQKDSFEPEILGPGNTVEYVWDDLTRPRRLVVQIDGLSLLREINLDKVRGWKPFYRVTHHRGLGSRLPLEKNPEYPKSTSFGKSFDQQMVNLGYEVYADGATRVLHFCDSRASFKREALLCSSKSVQIRVSFIALNLFERADQEMDTSEEAIKTPFLVGRVENISLVSMLTDQHKYYKMTVQSLSVDQKWVGAPFAAMLRRHQSVPSNTNGDILRIALVLLPSSSTVKQVKYSSVMLQPLDLNLDEETLMRLVPFWRTSLADSKTQSRQYYFDHFEIHPIKIIANFLPGDSYSSYISTQETLRTLIHSVIKIPVIKSKTIELNGVLVTHALITVRQLFLKCAQHYSWYAMRAIYIAKGSPLLPPAFASIFDDLASSSLDAFFDPCSGEINLPGLTIGTFKLISKCIDGKGFSGTKRYLGDLGKTVKTAGSNILFAAVTELSDSMLKGAEASGLNGMVTGFHQGVLKLAMEPSLLGAAFMEGGPDRKIVLDRSPGIDELYIEGYLQAMLDSIYKQEYLRVRVVDNQVFIKNLPPNSSLIEEIMDRIKSFLVSKALLKGDPSNSQPLRHLRGNTEWKIGPTVVTLCEHLFVSFAIRFLRRRANSFIASTKLKAKFSLNDGKAIVPAGASPTGGQKMNRSWKWGIGKFMASGVLAYIDGRLCRCIPHPVARRIVSGFVLSFLDRSEDE